jgi:glutamate dehydrogenase
MLTQAIPTDLRAERTDEVVKLVRAKVAPEQREALADFVQKYFGQVDPEERA